MIMGSRATFLRRSTRNSKETWFASIDSSIGSRFAAAFNDIANGFKSWRVWFQIASQSVRRQYSRTTLGPWWTVIQEALFIVCVGVVWGPLFGATPQGYVTYLAIGFIVFNLMSSLFTQACSAFIFDGGIASRHLAPLSSHILELIAGSFLRFLHSCVILIGFVFLGDFSLGTSVLVSVLTFGLLLLNAYLLALWLGPLTVRFRDIEPTIHAVMRLMFFVTPVMWIPDSLFNTSRSGILEFNPFYYFLDGIRNPLLGLPIPNHLLAVILGLTLFNAVVGMATFALTRSRVAYWGVQ